jgi:peroxiredoxin
MAEQVPAEILEGFGSAAAKQAAVDYAALAPKVGEAAPEFTLPDQLGRDVSLAGERAQGPVVLIFYRGEWCPYCNLILRTYASRAADFAERGARLVAVSVQTPDHSLSMAEKHELEFPVLSDEGGDVVSRYGLLYEVDEEVQGVYKAVGNDLAQFNGKGGWILPAPAVFVVDGEGTVRFVSVNGNWSERTEPDEVLTALDAL